MITGVGISVHWRAGIAECQHYREGTAGCFLQATKLREEAELVTWQLKSKRPGHIGQ